MHKESLQMGLALAASMVCLSFGTVGHAATKTTPVNNESAGTTQTTSVSATAVKKIAKRAYVAADGNSSVYKYTQTATNKGKLTAAGQLGTGKTWAASQTRDFTANNQAKQHYTYVDAEDHTLSGWVLQTALKIKATYRLGTTKKVSGTLYRKGNTAATVSFSGPSYDTKVSKPKVYLRQHPDTAWKVSQSRRVTDKTGRVQTYYYVKGGSTKGWVAGSGLAKRVQLTTKALNQNPTFPTGCEAVATAMMINQAGTKVSSTQVVNAMPKAKNKDGNTGFVGNPRSKSGWWIFPKPMAAVARKWLTTAVDITGASFTAIKKKLNRGHSVVVWLTGFGGQMTKINHAVLLTGYDTKRVYFNNPWDGKKESMGISTLQKYRKADKMRTISY